VEDLAGTPMARNFLESLVAVLTGNAVYFLLMPRLPEQVRHDPQHLDLGLLLDFCICLVIWGCVRILGKRPAKRLDR
jgi:hypothetical protein